MANTSNTRPWRSGPKRQHSFPSTTMRYYYTYQYSLTIVRPEWKLLRIARRQLKGLKVISGSRTNQLGLLAIAYALYWEAIIRLRQYESWKDSDSERFEYLLSFLRPRVQYAPSTFQHKVLFLEGPSPWCANCISWLPFSSAFIDRSIRVDGEYYKNCQKGGHVSCISKLRWKIT